MISNQRIQNLNSQKISLTESYSQNLDENSYLNASRIQAKLRRIEKELEQEEAVKKKICEDLQSVR